jgi:hypothetical protein
MTLAGAREQQKPIMTAQHCRVTVGDGQEKLSAFFSLLFLLNRNKRRAAQRRGEEMRSD